MISISDNLRWQVSHKGNYWNIAQATKLSSKSDPTWFKILSREEKQHMISISDNLRCNVPTKEIIETLLKATKLSSKRDPMWFNTTTMNETLKESYDGHYLQKTQLQKTVKKNVSTGNTTKNRLFSFWSWNDSKSMIWTIFEPLNTHDFIISMTQNVWTHIMLV